MFRLSGLALGLAIVIHVGLLTNGISSKLGGDPIPTCPDYLMDEFCNGNGAPCNIEVLVPDMTYCRSWGKMTNASKVKSSSGHCVDIPDGLGGYCSGPDRYENQGTCDPEPCLPF
jgi:hypothetical protein